MASHPQKTKQRAHFAWQEMVVARTDISPLHKMIAWALALHHNINNGQCDPSFARLAETAGASERTANRAIAELERLELIGVERTPFAGRGQRNSYRLLMPRAGVSETAERVSRQTPFEPQERMTTDAQKGDNGRRKGCHSFGARTRRTRGEALTEPPQHVEREEDVLTRINSPLGGGPPLSRLPAEEASSSSRVPPLVPEPPMERLDSVAREERFGELRAIWDRGHARDDTPEAIASAWRAYEQACNAGADPGDIIEGATTWAAAFEAADGLRYLPQMPAWLTMRGWEKPPPKRGRRSHANGRRNDGLPRSNGNKVDVAKLFFRVAGYTEEDDGRMVGGAQ
jgi:hypothetical protein